MNYSLHPEALADLREAATFYREQAATSLSLLFSKSLNNRSINCYIILDSVHHGADVDDAGI